MKISKYMTVNLITAKVDEGARTCFFRMKEAGVRHMPIVDEAGKLIGIISDRDLRRPDWVDEAIDISHVYQLDDAIRAGDLMTTSPVVVHTYDTFHKATRLFLEHRFGCLPVLDKNGDLVGIISPLDLLLAYDQLEGRMQEKG